jgi:hypothetical protein
VYTYCRVGQAVCLLLQPSIMFSSSASDISPVLLPLSYMPRLPLVIQIYKNVVIPMK